MNALPYSPALPPVGSIVDAGDPNDDFRARVVGIDEARRRVFVIPNDPGSIRDFAKGVLPPAMFQIKD